jgi:hypothetical protein
VFEEEIPVNRFQITDSLSGLCTGYFYTNEDDVSAGGKAIIYSDMGNKPLYKVTTNESLIDFRVRPNNPAGWRSGNFSMSGIAAGNSYIWFGVSPAEMWFPRYDIGSLCYASYTPTKAPNTYPQSYYNYNFKLSMYFTYSAAGQNYTRTLTQGVTLLDNRAIAGNYKRIAKQTAGNSDNARRFPIFLRKATEQIKIVFGLTQPIALLRECADNVNANSEAKRVFNVLRKALDNLSQIDSLTFKALFVRAMSDTATANQHSQHWRTFIRGLFDNAGSTAETAHSIGFYRSLADTVQAEGALFRGLLLFARIVTLVFVRDYLLSRFLKSKTELTLKSCVVREITLESRINGE